MPKACSLSVNALRLLLRAYRIRKPRTLAELRRDSKSAPLPVAEAIEELVEQGYYTVCGPGSWVRTTKPVTENMRQMLARHYARENKSATAEKAEERKAMGAWSGLLYAPPKPATPRSSTRVHRLEDT